MQLLAETFAEGGSLLHRLDPRLRLLFAAAFAVLIALATSLSAILAGLAVGLLLILLARLEIVMVLKRVLLINSFNLFLWVVLPFTAGGENLFGVGSLTFSRDGLLLAAMITLKANTIFLAIISMIATMPVATIGHAMNRLRVPEKVVYLLLFTYRYLFVIEQEYRRLATAMKVRGFSPGTNLHTYRSYANLFGMLLVRSMERAERVSQAMLCRGFKGKFHDLNRSTFTRIDRVFSLLMLFTLLALGNLEWLHHIL